MTEKITPAPQKPPALVHIELGGDFVGWWADCRTSKDLPARVFVELSAVAEGDATALVKLAEVLDKIAVRHNFPAAGGGGELATSFLDVTPDALAALSEAWSQKAFAADPR